MLVGGIGVFVDVTVLVGGTGVLDGVGVFVDVGSLVGGNGVPVGGIGVMVGSVSPQPTISKQATRTKTATYFFIFDS